MISAKIKKMMSDPIVQESLAAERARVVQGNGPALSREGEIVQAAAGAEAQREVAGVREGTAQKSRDASVEFSQKSLDIAKTESDRAYGLAQKDMKTAGKENMISNLINVGNVGLAMRRSYLNKESRKEYESIMDQQLAEAKKYGNKVDINTIEFKKALFKTMWAGRETS